MPCSLEFGITKKNEFQGLLESYLPEKDYFGYMNALVWMHTHTDPAHFSDSEFVQMFKQFELIERRRLGL